MADKMLNTVIVLRNDDKTSWETDGAYVLRDGEVGVGYFTVTDDNGNEKRVVMAKVGNGEQAWKDLPQLEGVFESDQILTYDFGRHKTSNGYVNAGGAGMTTSEWLLDALSEVLYPTVNYPSISAFTGGVYVEGATSTATSCEIGSNITAIRWDGTFSAGSYKDVNNSGTYGTSKDSTSSATGLSASNVTWSISNNKDSQTAATEDGKFTLVSGDYIKVNSETNDTYAQITATATLDASGAYTPLNNVGTVYEDGKITGFDAAGTTTVTKTAACKITGYRKPFWGVKTESIDIAAITSGQVRTLGSSGTATKGLPTSLEVPVGSTQVIFCAKAGTYSSLEAKDGNAMNAGVAFTKVANAVSVEGANNYDATPYDLWYVQWADPIASAKALSLTWK